MRGLARFTANSVLVIGSLAAVIMTVAALTALGEYHGGGRAILLFGGAFAVFLSSAATSSMLHLQASIDARLESFGGKVDVEPQQPRRRKKATRADRADHDESMEMFKKSRGEI